MSKTNKISSYTAMCLTLHSTAESPVNECRGVEVTSEGPCDPQPWRCTLRWPCRVVVDWTHRPGVFRRLAMWVVLGAKWTRKEDSNA